MWVSVAQVLLAPLLVGASVLAARRWGARVGGSVSAFPAIVGPVLLIVAHTRGTAFAADTATGTLAGLPALAAFVGVYAHVCRRSRWPVAVACGWIAAAVATAAVAPLRPELPAALALAAGSLVCAYLSLPQVTTAATDDTPGRGVWQRMALTAGLVIVLAALAHRFGALVGGMLTALPVLACILAASTHRAHGGDEAVALLRGMLAGMAGFVAFCATVATLTSGAGFAASFALATLAAAASQVLTVARLER